MKKVSLEKGLVIMLLALTGFTACKKETTEPIDGTPETQAAAVADSAQAEAPEQGEFPAAAVQPVQATVAALSAVGSVSTTVSTGSPIGFAAVNGMTTGGKGGQTVTVTTLSALKSALASSSPMIIRVSGKISGSTGLTVKSNKTIVGVNGGTLDGLGLLMYGVNNIIVQNLVFQNMKASDAITMKSAAHHIWIDHCTFQGSVYDGFVDVTRESDYVTISWSKFSGAAKNILIGADDSHTSDKGKLRVTLHHNLFANNYERSPSVRFGQVHVFNNLYTGSNTSYGVAARIGSTVRTDNNYFENFKGAPLRTLDPSPGVISGAATNVYAGSGANKISTKASTWVPSYSYSSVLASAANVPAAVKAGAGAK